MTAPAPINPDAEHVPAPTAPPSAANQAAAGNYAAAVSNQAANASTKIRTMEDLKRESPKLYKATMMGIAQMIIRDMRDHAERLKQAIRKGSG